MNILIKYILLNVFDIVQDVSENPGTQKITLSNRIHDED